MSGDIVVNDSFEILTPSGWKNFLGIKRSFKQTLEIKFASGKNFICTPEHVLISNKKQIKACSLKPGNILYKERVVSISLKNIPDDVYDPIEVDGGNIYFSSGLESHNCTFLGSSATLVRSDIIAQMSPINPIMSKDGLDVYEKPQPDHAYVIVADTAKGIGGDYSAFVVIDVNEFPYKIAAKYRDNKISPLLYPSVIYTVAKNYNEAHVLIEINSSEQVSHILHYEYEYENLIPISRTSKGQDVSFGFGGVKLQLGVLTDKKVKRIGCTMFKNLVEEKKLLVFDSDAISEISTFIETKNTYAADDGYHDDIVMCLVLFSWLTTTPYFRDLKDINIRQAIFDNRIKMIEDELTPFGFFNDGRDDSVSSESLELLR